MLVSTKGRYALRLMVCVAQGPALGKVTLRSVAEHEGISLKYLEQLARPLLHAGFLRSVRGKGGGYALARDASSIRAGDVLRAVERTTAPVACLNLEEGCPRAEECSTARFWAGLDGVIEQYVDGVTLEDLATPPASAFRLFDEFLAEPQAGSETTEAESLPVSSSVIVRARQGAGSSRGLSAR